MAESIEQEQARQLRGEHAFGPHPGTKEYREAAGIPLDVEPGAVEPGSDAEDDR